MGLSSLAVSTYHPAFAQTKQSSLQPGHNRKQDPALTIPGRYHPMLVARQEGSGSTRQSLTITAGNLQTALLELSQQSGVELLYPSDLVAGLQTQGLDGSYTPDEALGRLLQGTGLQYRFSDTNVVTLFKGEKDKVKKGPKAVLVPEIVVKDVVDKPAPFLPPVDGYKADKATGLTRTPLAIEETPSSVGVVTRDVIKDTFSRSQGDAFENVSGVSRNSTSRLGRSESFNIRGFQTNFRFGSFGALRSNGLPLDTSWAPDWALVERYEIIKGPSSIVGGASSPGGVVNRVTKTPQDSNFAHSDFQAGSYDFYRGVIDANGVLPSHENVRGRMIFAVEEGGNFVDNVDVRQYTIAPSLEFDLFKGAGTLLLTGHYQNFDGSSYRGVPFMENGKIPDISREENFGGGSDNGAKTTFEGQNYEAHYFHEFINDLKLSLKGKYSKSDILDKTIYPYGYSYGNGGTPIPVTGTAYQQLSFERNDWNTWAGEVFVSKGFEWLGREHEIVVGADRRNQELKAVRSFAYQYPPDNIFDPANTFKAPSDEFLESTAFNSRRATLKQTGVYGQLVVRPLPKLTLVGAFRNDWLDEKYHNRISGAKNDGDVSKSTGRVGATYELFPGIHVYGGWSQSFQSNVLSPPQVNGDLLPPSTGDNYEIGAKWDLLDGRMLITTALYRSYRKNIPSADPANQGFSILIGEQRSQGLEFDITGRPLPGLNVLGAFTYYDAEITKDDTGLEGTTPLGIPRGYIGRVFATYELQSGPLQGFGFGGGVAFQGPYEVQNFNAQQPFFRTDPYQRVDAVVFYRPPKKAYDFTINVRNLLNQTYIESPGFDYAFNGFGAPVSVFGTLRVYFGPGLDWSPPWVK
ncbi:MAG: ligand-gated channel [Nitrospirales bacterium]|nr:MAG: ligand-gated channel [Nitrospirales bacterium]